MAVTVPPGRLRAHRAARCRARAYPHWPGWGLPYRRMRGRVRIFVMWRRHSAARTALEPDAVARSLRETLAPLFAAPLRATVHADDVAGIVFLERPVEGWRAPFAQRDAHGRAFAVDYPIGVPRVLAACGHARPAPDGELPALGRALAHDPAPVLRELPPPF